jgi:hypothetical protein
VRRPAIAGSFAEYEKARLVAKLKAALGKPYSASAVQSMLG